MTALTLTNLTVRFGDSPVVRDVSLSVAPGEVIGIVGESGAGKSMLLRALLGLTPVGAVVSTEALRVHDRDMRNAPETAWRTVRGRDIGFIGQDALLSLDPLRRIGDEVAEAMAVHDTVPIGERESAVLDLLRDVAIPAAERRAKQRPGELSGGLRQRALIASALSAGPSVLLADEPTTALDATVQVRVLELLRSLADAGRAVVVVSHDLHAVASIADRVIVMQAGSIVEEGTGTAVLTAPQHVYTQRLVSAVHRETAAVRAPGERAALTVSECSVVFRDGTRALDDVSVVVHEGRVLGIVGESGSGKTTLARVMVGAIAPTTGSVTRPESDSARPALQLVAQSPRAALNPHWRIRRSLAEAIRDVPRPERAALIAEALDRVELPADFADRKPAQLSGGQLQRVVIARALLARPKLLVLDEALSALDVSVAADILALLRQLQRETGMAMAFISHDLGVVASLADDLVVMQDGRIIERGATHAVFAKPEHSFTRALIDASVMQ